MHQTAAATVGVTLALFFVAVSRARGESSPSRERRRSPGSRESEGFVDLIRDECELLRKQEEVVQPSLSRKQLTAGRLVVVIIGPSSTGVHQVSLGFSPEPVESGIVLLMTSNVLVVNSSATLPNTPILLQYRISFHGFGGSDYKTVFAR